MSCDGLLNQESQQKKWTGDWYNRKQTSLGNEFLADLRTTVGRIEHSPESFSLVDDFIRVGKLHRFPYGVYFEQIQSEQAIYIYGVIHLHRDESAWRARRF
jgi:hypothetical protein